MECHKKGTYDILNWIAENYVVLAICLIFHGENAERGPQMADKKLFSSKKHNRTKVAIKGRKSAPKPFRVVATDTTNEAGGKAYSFSAKHGLAQYVATGCLGSTYYATGQEQLAKIIELGAKVGIPFLAKCAVYGREKAFMKDTPALLMAMISSRVTNSEDREIFAKAFRTVIDNGKMLRNFVQMIRSGELGRSSFGSQPKALINEWLTNASDKQIVRASIGNDPSLCDIIKMTHPKPSNKGREALFGHIIGKNVNLSKLPEILQNFEAFKQGETEEVPEVPWEMLTSQNLGKQQWEAIGRKMGWQALRMNLETLQRHEVFENSKMVSFVAKKLADAEEIEKARVFPYQLLMAYIASTNVPDSIHKALEDALEVATENVPKFEGNVVVCPDVSGSMHSPVTGNRGTATTAVQCIDVAALVSACVLRKNPSARVIPFSDHVVSARINPRDTVMTNADKLRDLPSGGTNCSAPLVLLNKEKESPDLIIYVSDNQSWVDFTERMGSGGMREFKKIRDRNPRSKVVAIDLQPYGSTQFSESDSVMNIGGFSDHVFELINEFNQGHLTGDHWVKVIEEVEL